MPSIKKARGVCCVDHSRAVTLPASYRIGKGELPLGAGFRICLPGFSIARRQGHQRQSGCAVRKIE